MQKDLRIKISIDKKTGELKVVESEFDKLNKRVKTVSKSTSTFKNDLMDIAKGAVGIYAINEAFKAVIKTGFDYNSQLENAKGGLVALSVAIQDKTIPVTERYARANAEATKTLQELQNINAQTPHTLDQTNQIYKAMYVSMRSVGASTSDLIELTKNISIASGAAGIEFNNLLAGVDGLATGTVLANSDLGRFLKGLGLTNEALKNSKNVTKLLLDKLKDFKAMDTMTVAVSNFTNTWQQMAGDITKPLFEKTKQDLKGFTKTLDKNRNDIVEFGRDTIRVGQLVANGYESIFTSSKIGYLEVALEFRKEIDAIDNYVMKTIVETNNYWADSWIGKKAGLSKMNFNPSTVDANALRTEIRASKNELIGIGLESDKLVKSIENDTVAQEKFNKKLKNINISNRPTIYDRIKLGLKWKITLWWKLIWTFNNRVYFSKRFIKATLITSLSLFVFLWITAFFIEYKVKSWYEKILSIKENLWDISFIQNTINNAKLDFIASDILFKPFLLIPNNNIRNWYYLLQWWKKITEFIDKSIHIYLSLNDFINKKWWINNIKLTNLLINTRSDLSELNWYLYNIIVDYDNIQSIWNKDIEWKISFIKNELKDIYRNSNIINKKFDILLSILWDNKERKYLILFQNNDEIRATWWFIWSLATITVKKWQIINFEKNDVYAYEWNINKVYKTKSIAPEWLNRITNNFWLRDSNYFIDFESSSKSINFFLKKINKNVDWIIYINQNTFLDFLKLTWPINFDQIWDKIWEENFSLMISTLVEAQSFKVWTLWTPKKVLFDFANIFLSKLKQDKQYFAYLDLLAKNIKSRDLVIYSFNPEENNLLWQLWLNWKIDYSKSLDYSYPVYTSIWWNKSDRYIKIKYKKEIHINKDCSIDTNLNIFRTHLFTKNEEFKVNNLLDKFPIKDKTRKDILNIQWKWVNKTYVRVILPKNAVIKPKKWMNINKYEKSIVVDFYMNTSPLETTNFNIQYKIINNDCLNYNYKIYKQPWIRNYWLDIIQKNNKVHYDKINNDYYYKK